MSESKATRFRVVIDNKVVDDELYGIGQVRHFVKFISKPYKVESFTKGEWRPVKV